MNLLRAQPQEDGLFVDLSDESRSLRRLVVVAVCMDGALILCRRNRLFSKHGLDNTVRYRLRYTINCTTGCHVFRFIFLNPTLLDGRHITGTSLLV